MKRPDKAKSYPLGAYGACVTVLPTGAIVVNMLGFTGMLLTQEQVAALRNALLDAMPIDDRANALIQALRNAVSAWQLGGASELSIAAVHHALQIYDGPEQST